MLTDTAETRNAHEILVGKIKSRKDKGYVGGLHLA
jgi:hypothetical protein